MAYSDFKTIWIDREDYLIKELGKLLGILVSPFQEST